MKTTVWAFSSHLHLRANTSQIISLLGPFRNRKTLCDRLKQRSKHDPLENGNRCGHAQKTWSLGAYQSLTSAFSFCSLCSMNLISSSAHVQSVHCHHLRPARVLCRGEPFYPPRVSTNSWRTR